MLVMVQMIPLPEDIEPVSDWVPTDDERNRGKRIAERINLMLIERRKHEDSMEQALLLYSGKSRANPRDPRKERVVIPMARAFVDAKTAEEIKGMNSYEFDPGKHASDQWMAELIKDVDEHVRTKTKMDIKRLQALRMKNITGVSILKVGYRKIMRFIKDPVETDDDNTGLTWKERKVPIYDDLFIDLVSPFHFAIDPNATSMEDAMDCAHFHTEHYEVFYETYNDDKRFKNIDSVKGGYQNQVDVCEYYNAIRDEWVTMAFPSTQGGKGMSWTGQIPAVEIGYLPLPDSHKMLPFVSYHNNPTFVSSYVRDIVAQSSTGSPLSQTEDIRADEGFWTEGDPMTIMDLIDLRTGFGRAAYRSIKLSSEGIIATAPGYAFDESRKWREGEQAVGMMGKYQVDHIGSTNIGNFEFVFGDLMEQMVLALGIDPRNLADNKTKTATESQIQKETQLLRLEPCIEFNEMNAEVRLGTLILKLVEQRYSKPELVMFTGAETEEEISNFDNVVSVDGKPSYGKRFRVIPSKNMIKEKQRKNHDGTYKYYLTKSEEGTNSFLARPEYIRSSDVRVVIRSGRDGATLRAVKVEMAQNTIKLILEMINSMAAMPPGTQIITPDDLPNIKEAVKMLMEAMGWNPLKMGQAETAPDSVKKAASKFAQYQAQSVPLSSKGQQVVPPPIQQ